MQRAEICITNLLQGGATCTSPTITWDNAETTCLLINCIDDGCVIVQIPDDCEDKCISFIIDCEDCDQCPPQRITRCLCDDLDECPNCSECAEGGFCEPVICSGTEQCDPVTGDCVQCLLDGDCSCDQECVNNLCQCPPGQQINAQGCCVDCLNNDDCPACEQCRAGACEPVVCATGICNPETDICVECVENGDCVGDNTCCVNGRCTCCPGYYLNSEGDCVEIPDCVTNGDCPACFICEDGECVPQVCPDGRTCVDGDCVLACDCLNPNCPQGQVCVTGPFGVCYCTTCSGGCATNADCGEGCTCVNGQCVTAPCYGPCTSGSDCGDGCGCQGGQCVSCDSLTCVQCATVLGCQCTDSVTCVNSPCDNPCANANDCATGCGCQDNNCVGCNAVSCTTNANCPEGCFCNNGTCSANPCANTYCSSPEDCGPGCTCVNGRCVPCSSLSCNTLECANTPGCACNGGACQDDNADCTDELTLTKIDGTCDLRGELSTTGCCQCDFITATLGLVATETGTDEIYDYNFTVTLKKNNVILSGTGVTNELPTAGIFRVRIVDTLVEVMDSLLDSNFQIGDITTATEDVFINIANLATATDDTNLNGSRLPRFIAGKWYRVTNRRIELSTSTSLLFPNECRYSLPTQIFNNTAGTIPPAVAAPDQTYTLTRLVNCRKPLFKFYRDTDATGIFDNANLIESVYADRISPTLYRHTLTGYEDLQYGRYYGLDTDCGCADPTVYSCNNDGVATPLVFCDPTAFEYEISDCGKTLTITENVTITCDVYTALGAPKPVYNLLINGVIVATRTLGTAPSVGAVLFNATTDTWTVDDVITTIRLEIVGDACDDCAIEYTEALAGLTSTLFVESECSGQEDADATFTITGGTAPYDYEIFNGVTSVASGTVVTDGPFTVDVPNTSGNFSVVITDADLCEATGLYTFVTTNVGGEILISTICVGNQGYIEIVNNSALNANVSIPTIGNSVVNAGTSSSILAATGAYTVTVTPVGAAECAVIQAVEINCCLNTELNNVGVSYSCTSGLSYIGLQGGWTTVIRNQANDTVALGVTNSLPPATYNITISDGSCSVIKQIVVPTCYTCVAEACVAATPNIGSTLVSCQQTCGACETCDFQTLYMNGRILSVRISGVDVLVGSSIGVTCSGTSVIQVGTFTTTLTNLLLSQGDCGTPSLSISCAAVPVSPETFDPNDCLPTTGFWATVTVNNSGLQIDGVTTDDGCFVPSDRVCEGE